MKFIVYLVLGMSTLTNSFHFVTEDECCQHLPGFNTVIDLSRATADVNFTQVKQDGIRGVIHKATHGTKWRDPKYCHRKREALKNGLLWGAYHYGTQRPGFLQANHFLKSLGDSHNMLLALDLEDPKRGSEMTLRQAEDFVKTVKRSTGRYPMVYGSDHLAELMKGRNTVLFKCPLWIARYGPRAFVPKHTWTNWTLWQYTDGRSGPYPHIVCGVGRCDRDSVNDQLFQSVDKMWTEAGI